ncbi:MAG TPA: nuclear transport factor 2 family protein [Rhizomicrobium sp.]|jgi:uncharacterized protein (TIGR02246 family)
MAFERSQEDRLAIRERIESYADAVFQRDADAWGANWADDAVWSLMGTEVKGKANIVAMWRQAMAGFSFVSFFGNPGSIAIHGDTADVRVYTLEFLVETGGNARRVVGQYDDKLVKRDGHWLFQSRNYRILSDT